MRKQTSTNVLNEQFLFTTCELNSALNVISGRWKSQIIIHISQGNNRFSFLKKVLPKISDQVLSRQLKELENQSVIIKHIIKDIVPTGIEYSLTNHGITLVPILESLCNWGKTHISKR